MINIEEVSKDPQAAKELHERYEIVGQAFIAGDVEYVWLRERNSGKLVLAR